MSRDRSFIATATKSQETSNTEDSDSEIIELSI